MNLNFNNILLNWALSDKSSQTECLYSCNFICLRFDFKRITELTWQFSFKVKLPLFHTGCARDPDLHRQKYLNPNFLSFFGFAKTIQLLITQKKIRHNHKITPKAWCPPPKLYRVFYKRYKKVFHFQICDSLLIHKGHDPWHTRMNYFLWPEKNRISLAP